GPPLEVLARDGGVELDHRLAALDGRIGPARDDRARLQQALPRVGALEPLHPEPRRREIEVADRGPRLPRGGDAELGQAWQVCGAEDLRMLDAPAWRGDLSVARGHGVERLLVVVEDRAVRAVADRVRLDLDAALQGALEHRDELLLGVLEEPRRIVVGVG